MRRWIVVGLLLLAALWALLLWIPEVEPPALVDSEAPDQAAMVPPPSATVFEPHATPSASPPSAAVPAARSTEPEPQATAAEPPPPASAPTYKLPKLPPPEPSGPVSALKLRFGNESYSADSKLRELQLTASLQRTGPPPGSVESVLCRRSVCRVSWRWQAQHVISFYQALGALRHDVEPNLGIDAPKPMNVDEAQTLYIYLNVTSDKSQAH